MKKKYKPGQHVYRIPPCPSYDIAGMEKWLADLAEKGLFLTKDGFFAGIATFEYGEPKKAKYRLEASQKSTSMWSDNNGEPDPEQIEISLRYSWEYVAKCKDFFIYRSLDPSARELNTDPVVQAIALNAVKKRQREAVFSSVLLLVGYPLILTRGCPIMTALAIGTWWTAIVLLFAVLMIADEIRAFMHLKNIQKALIEEGCYALKSDWKKTSVLYFARKVMKTMLIIILICTFLHAWSLTVTDENKIPIAEYAGELPFAVMLDFAGEGSSDYKLTMTGLRMGFNTIEEKTDWLATHCIAYNEHAAVRKADGNLLDGGLYVDYYELRSPILGKLLVKELYRFDKMKKDFTLTETPDLMADDAVCYLDNLHFPTIIIRKGNIVVKASFYQTSELYSMSMDEWAKMLCDSVGK